MLKQLDKEETYEINNIPLEVINELFNFKKGIDIDSEMLIKENDEFIFEDNINSENKMDEILQINNDINNILKNGNNGKIFDIIINDKKLKKCKYDDNDYNDIMI